MRRADGMLAGMCALLMAAALPAFAGSPRWVMGTPYYAGQGAMAYWHNNHPLYYTDPGDLSAYVNHAAADALVAAAMNTWNVPQALLVLAQGGELNEHVSGANVYIGASGPVFPADVMSANAAAMPIAVIYDSDGSVTDLLLGAGASDPSGCLQNAVTSSVDLLQPSGDIQHALLVLNGRCTGPAPQQQLQMQYQLERALGRILGLGWSQVNDNVFTGTPQPTAQQLAYWPIMHPIDVMCGTYTYQCLTNPFQLRADDISTLALLYPVAKNNVPAGKEYSLLHGETYSGTVAFPTGQGMQNVNVVAQTNMPGLSILDPWQLVSGVSGVMFQQSGGNPVTGMPSIQHTDGDSMETVHEGSYVLKRIPITPSRGTQWNGVYVFTEPINPLYTGTYSVGAMTVQTIAASGSAKVYDGIVSPGGTVYRNMALTGAADCETRQDGTEASPAPIAAGGWWTGRLCAYRHTAWSTLAVKAGRTLTLEVTALDESNHATTNKAMPVIGVWPAAAALGQLPTIAATPGPFNSVALGMTTLTASAAQTQPLRVAIADLRGDGRPDFAYQARVLYADAVSPARLPGAGGQITVTGMGFRAGNTVTVGGVNAPVVRWSATQIVAMAPALSAVTTGADATADVVVTDLTTHGTTTMSGALTYNGAPTDVMRVAAAPSGNVPVGTVAPAAFTVQLLEADGATPVAGAPVSFAGTNAAALLGSCNAASCAVTTDDSGYASTTVIPQAVGTVSLTATAAGGASQSASFAAVAVTHSIAALRPIEYVAAENAVTWAPEVSVALNGVPAGNTAVTWSATAASLPSAQTMTNAAGMAQSAATTASLAAGAQATVQACAWQTACATMSAQAVDASLLRLQAVSGAGQSVALGSALAPVTLRVTDGANNPVAGATVQVHQSAEGQQSCPGTGRCPTPPVYGTTQAQVVSDEDGLVTVQPLETPGRSEVVNLAAAVGTQGFLSLSLLVGP